MRKYSTEYNWGLRWIGAMIVVAVVTGKLCVHQEKYMAKHFAILAQAQISETPQNYSAAAKASFSK